MTPGFPIAAATATFADRLTALVGDAVRGTRVTTLNPGAEALRGGDPIVNLYLFRTVRNGSMSNADLPTRGSDGRAKATPQLVLTLDYMISFFGNDAQLDPQRLLGLVAAGLWAWPVLAPAETRATVATTPWLAGTDPALAPMRISAMNLTPEEMARVWSEFVHVPYQLTQLYSLMSVALPEPVPIAPVLPVRRIGVRVRPLRALRVSDVVNAADPALPLIGGGQMAVLLADPAQPGLTVELDGTKARGVTAGFDADGAAALLVPLDATQPGLTTGTVGVRVVRAADGHRDDSAIVQCPVVPGLAGPASVDAERVLQVPMALPVPPGVAAAILLYPTGGDRGPGLRIACADRTAPVTTLTAPLGKGVAGDYLLSVEIDGLVSTLTHDGDGYTGPSVTIAGQP